MPAICAIGYATVLVGGMFKASRICEFSETMANWANVLDCNSLMHLKMPLHSLKETSKSVNSYGRPWLDAAKMVKGVKFNVEASVAPLAIRAVGMVEMAVLAVGAVEMVEMAVLVVEAVEAVGSVCPVTAPFVVNGIEAVEGVGPVVTPFTVEPVAAVDAGGPTVFPAAATVLIGPKFVLREGHP